MCVCVFNLPPVCFFFFSATKVHSEPLAANCIVKGCLLGISIWGHFQHPSGEQIPVNIEESSLSQPDCCRCFSRMVASQVHRSLRAEFLSPELVSSYLVKLQEGLKGWIGKGGIGSLLRARLSGGNGPWRTSRKIGEGGWIKRKHLMMVLDTGEYWG